MDSQLTTVTAINERRIGHLKRIMGDDWIIWFGPATNYWYIQHKHRPISMSCKNYWEIFRWCRDEKEKENGGKQGNN